MGNCSWWEIRKKMRVKKQLVLSYTWKADTPHLTTRNIDAFRVSKRQSAFFYPTCKAVENTSGSEGRLKQKGFKGCNLLLNCYGGGGKKGGSLIGLRKDCLGNKFQVLAMV